MKEPEPAKAVVKTMRILECLSQERSLGVTELANRVSKNSGSLHMDKSTVYRFLNSLKELGFVRQDPETEQYSMTLKLFEIGMAVLDRLELWREAQPVIKQVAQATGETVHLASLDGDGLVYLGKIESSKTLRVSMMSRVGQSAPAYCTGLGKTLLAHLARDRVTEILNREKMVRFTERTITKRADLDRELETIRRTGYAVDNEEHEIGVRCVAAPVYDNAGEVIAAVSISVPSVRLIEGDIPRYGETVMRAARKISGRLGHKQNGEERTERAGRRSLLASPVYGRFRRPLDAQQF
jgi:IclR family KDG regulon transcriptional repressor